MALLRVVEAVLHRGRGGPGRTIGVRPTLARCADSVPADRRDPGSLDRRGPVGGDPREGGGQGARRGGSALRRFRDGIGEAADPGEGCRPLDRPGAGGDVAMDRGVAPRMLPAVEAPLVGGLGRWGGGETHRLGGRCPPGGEPLLRGRVVGGSLGPGPGPRNPPLRVVDPGGRGRGPVLGRLGPGPSLPSIPRHQALRFPLGRGHLGLGDALPGPALPPPAARSRPPARRGGTDGRRDSGSRPAAS